MIRSSARYAPLVGLALTGLLAIPLTAQNPPLPETATAMIETATGPNLALPQPPRAFLNEVPIGGLPVVPVVDAGLPQPNSAPCTIGDLNNQVPLAGAFTFFRNRDHRPSGASQLHPGEPSTAASRDTYFATGNTYGSLSKDSGMTWSHVNPFTLFPAVDGGACCDQRVIADPASGLMLWYVQYRYSATTGAGGFRLAWTRSRDQLRNSQWSSVYFNAASFALAGNWLDFPDIAVSNDHVYMATNVFNASSAYQNSLIIRIPLNQLSGGGSVVATYYRRTGGSGPMNGGASYRFTQTYNGSPAVEMYWASHNSTSSIRIFRWDDANAGRFADVDRTIPAWTSGAGAAPGPDGRDWIGFDDHRIASGYASPVSDEGGFLWSSNGNGGSRPQSYVRVQAFSLADRSIIATEDVWNGTFDFAFPAIGMNSLGHGGVVMSGGSATTNVTTYALLSDNYTPFFAGATIFALATGTNGAPSNRWGDYHSVVANPIDPRTFIGTGMHMIGGSGTNSTVHRTTWFGRDDYTPAWVSLSVSSSPSGAAITVDETDRNGSSSGTAPFVRSYTPQQGYTLRAPASLSSGGNTYLFANWSGTGGSTASQVFTVSSIGASAHGATATYGLQSTVTVDDRNVAGSVAITVGTTDLDGLSNGSTLFTRRYRTTDGPFAFTAPSAAGIQPFRRWYLNNIAQPLGQVTISVAPATGAVTIEAEYCSYTAGAYTTYGSGCPGSNALVPAHSSVSRPDIGSSVTHSVSGFASPTPAIMVIGLSRTTYNGSPLPLNLGFIGTNPACNLLASITLNLPITIGGTGSGSLTFALPNDPSAISQHIFSQVIGVDIFVPFRMPIIVSNGLDMMIGGRSLGGGTCP